MAQLNTFSCLVRCPQTGQIGGASASCYLAVGSIVFGSDPAVGMVFSQAHANPALKFLILEHLKTNPENWDHTLQICLASDPNAKLRQVGFLTFEGHGSAETGASTHEFAGHVVGENYVVAGNTLQSMDVLSAIKEAIERGQEKAKRLSQILIDALVAAEKAGGDRRGKQSACMQIVKSGFRTNLMDLRVDDNDSPIQELERLCSLYNADYSQAWLDMINLESRQLTVDTKK